MKCALRLPIGFVTVPRFRTPKGTFISVLKGSAECTSNGRAILHSDVINLCYCVVFIRTEIESSKSWGSNAA